MTQPSVAHISTVDLTPRFLLLNQLTGLRDRGYRVVSISASGPWVEDLTNAGIEHVTWPHIARSWGLRGDLKAFRSLLRILRSGSFDLVHTHSPKGGALGRVAARLAGVPCVVNTVHGFYATPEDHLGRRLLVLSVERIAASFSDLEFYQSSEDRSWALKRKVVAPEKAVWLGNGVDLAHFSSEKVPATTVKKLKAELGIPTDAPVVGTVGRLTREKGWFDFKNAARRVLEEVPNVFFMAVGEEEEGGAGSDPGVVITGWRDDVRDLLATMDVFVLPSWREGVPRSAIEAAAMGLPLVLTDIRGCREIVRHGVEGLLVPPRNSERLAGAITSLLRDPVLRKECGARSRSRAEEHFDEARVVKTVQDCYSGLLVRRGLRPMKVEGVSLRGARKTDLKVLAQAHEEGLPMAFLPKLGRAFLERLYLALIRDPSAVVLVAEQDGRLNGFAAGVANSSKFKRRFVLRHGLQALFAANVRLLKAKTIKGASETSRYPGFQTANGELVSIVVEPRARGKGIGRALGTGILAQLRALGATSIRVVTPTTNEEANRLYSDLGFVPAGATRVHEGVDSRVWITE